MIFFSVFRNSQTAKRRDRISATGCATHAEQRTYRHEKQEDGSGERNRLCHRHILKSLFCIHYSVLFAPSAKGLIEAYYPFYLIIFIRNF